jgi:hypothetical protein
MIDEEAKPLNPTFSRFVVVVELGQTNQSAMTKLYSFIHSPAWRVIPEHGYKGQIMSVVSSPQSFSISTSSTLCCQDSLSQFSVIFIII